MVKVLVFQHVPFEGLGQIESQLLERGARIECQRWFENPDRGLPEPADVDLLIVMGGPMSVHDVADYPWLVREKAWIRKALAADIPMLGICLGAQLIAEALGAQVGRNPEPEIGWFPIELTEVGQALFGHDPKRPMVLHWHGESFDLPPDAERLAGSAACAQQGFLHGNGVVGLQFHLEMRSEDVGRLIANSRGELIDRPWVQDEARLSAEPEETFTQTHGLMRQLLSRLLD